jgi:hypothetical protein
MDYLTPLMTYVQPTINLVGWVSGAETGAISGLINGIREADEWITRSPSLGPSLEPILTYGLIAYDGYENLSNLLGEALSAIPVIGPVLGLVL